MSKVSLKNGSREGLELSTLYEISTALGSSQNLGNTLHEVLELLSRKMGVGRSSITLYDPSNDELVTEAAFGLTMDAKERGKYKIGEGITGRVFQSGEPAIVPSVSKEPLFLNKTGARKDLHRKDISFICVPIKNAKHPIGTISVDRLFEGEEISLDEDLRLLSIIASMIAQTAQLYRSVHEEKNRLMEENIQLRHELQDKFRIHNIIGHSSKMREVFEMIENVAKSNATVLIRGESGTGKELVAHAIHYNSPRGAKPFVKVNCAALPESLLESELFGYEKGAFTGAHERKIGRFEMAHSGTIFLDEIGEFSIPTQAKILRVLQEREIERLGGTKTIPLDVRVITATNKNLEEALRAGLFREDLYYRLNVFPVYIPPLRDRKDDLPLLVDYFIEKYAREHGRSIKRISTQAIDMLMLYHWPGNVRELENTIERAILVASGSVIQGHHLPPTLQLPTSQTIVTGRISFENAVENYERELILDALKASAGNQSQAARLLGTTWRVIGYKAKKLGIDTKRYVAKGK